MPPRKTHRGRSGITPCSVADPIPLRGWERDGTVDWHLHAWVSPRTGDRHRWCWVSLLPAGPVGGQEDLDGRTGQVAVGGEGSGHQGEDERPDEVGAGLADVVAGTDGPPLDTTP